MPSQQSTYLESAGHTSALLWVTLWSETCGSNVYPGLARFLITARWVVQGAVQCYDCAISHSKLCLLFRNSFAKENIERGVHGSTVLQEECWYDSDDHVSLVGREAEGARVFEHTKGHYMLRSLFVSFATFDLVCRGLAKSCS
jgi:hypothetical protein